MSTDASWRWVYLIPLTALLIPIVAILAGTGAFEHLEWLLVALALVGGGTLSGRYLIRYRHQLRMAELDRELKIAALEAGRLEEANRLLDREVEDLRSSLRHEPGPEPNGLEQPAG